MKGTRRAARERLALVIAMLALKSLVVSITVATPLVVRSAINPDLSSSLRRDLQRDLLSTSPTESSLQSEQIRVRLDSTKQNSMSITGVGLRYPGMPSRHAGVFQALRVSWRYQASGLHEWLIKDRDTNETLAQVRARTFDVAGDGLRVDLKPVPGRLTLRPTAARATDIITALDLEAYVRGVLPAEMPSSWPLEALKAQAIAARSFALFRKRVREQVRAPYHVEAGVMDQMYLIPVLEEGSDESRARADQAVRETRGLVLAGQDGALAAYFHADCGGRTESARAVWGSGGAGTAIDGSCPLNPLAKWRTKLSATEIGQKLRGSRVALLDVRAVDHTESGRINQMKLVWNDGTESQLTAHELRMALGHERIKSTNFEVAATSGGAFEFSGSGFGHGVGMCQWGARHLARSGQTAAGILRHYYPRAQLKNLPLGSETLAATVEPNAAR